MRCCLHDPGFSQRLNSKCDSAEDLSIIGVETVEAPLPINSLDSHHTQRKQDEVLDRLYVLIFLKENSLNGNGLIRLRTCE